MSRWDFATAFLVALVGIWAWPTANSMLSFAKIVFVAATFCFSIEYLVSFFRGQASVLPTKWVVAMVGNMGCALALELGESDGAFESTALYSIAIGVLTLGWIFSLTKSKRQTAK